MNQRKNATVTGCWTPEEVEKAERYFLEKLTPEDRIALTWQLRQEQWALKCDYESRFSRHHTRFIRSPVHYRRAYAVNMYVDPRATGDLDIWIEPSQENDARVCVLSEFAPSAS